LDSNLKIKGKLSKTTTTGTENPDSEISLYLNVREKVIYQAVCILFYSVIQSS
jgi:hypothetical protein